MAFTRKFIRDAAKDSGIELPRELEDLLVQEHINARDAYASEKVEIAIGENKPIDVKESNDYKALKKEFDDFKENQAKKDSRNAKENAYREILKNAGVSDKRIASVIKVSNIDGIEFNKDGSVKDVDSLTESIKKEWSDFITTTKTTGATTANPPASSQVSKSPDDMSMAEYIKYRKGNDNG